MGKSRGLLVADNEGLVRSTTGLAHTVQLSLETASQEGQPQPTALVADSKVSQKKIQINGYNHGLFCSVVSCLG